MIFLYFWNRFRITWKFWRNDCLNIVATSIDSIELTPSGRVTQYYVFLGLNLSQTSLCMHHVNIFELFQIQKVENISQLGRKNEEPLLQTFLNRNILVNLDFLSVLMVNSKWYKQWNPGCRHRKNNKNISMANSIQSFVRDPLTNISNEENIPSIFSSISEASASELVEAHEEIYVIYRFFNHTLLCYTLWKDYTYVKSY